MFGACHGGAWNSCWPHFFCVTAHDAAQAVREAALRTLDRGFKRLHGKPTLVRGSKHASHAPCMDARMHFRSCMDLNTTAASVSSHHAAGRSVRHIVAISTPCNLAQTSTTAATQCKTQDKTVQPLP